MPHGDSWMSDVHLKTTLLATNMQKVTSYACMQYHAGWNWQELPTWSAKTHSHLQATIWRPQESPQPSLYPPPSPAFWLLPEKYDVTKFIVDKKVVHSHLLLCVLQQYTCMSHDYQVSAFLPPSLAYQCYLDEIFRGMGLFETEERLIKLWSCSRVPPSRLDYLLYSLFHITCEVN